MAPRATPAAAAAVNAAWNPAAAEAEADAWASAAEAEKRKQNQRPARGEETEESMREKALPQSSTAEKD